MPKAKARDGAFQRKDRGGWWVSFIDSGGTRRRQKVEAHTRTQAMNALSAVKTREQRNKVLGVKEASEMTTADLLTRYKRHQKTRIRATTVQRLGGTLHTLRMNLPEKARTSPARM